MLRKSDSTSGVTECPSCHEEHELAINSFQAISPVVTKLLSNLMICCEVPSCTKPVYFNIWANILKVAAKRWW